MKFKFHPRKFVSFSNCSTNRCLFDSTLLNPTEEESNDETNSITRLIVASALAASLTGCATTYREADNGPYQSCSPSYSADTQVGDFSIQQNGAGSSLQRGAYPNAEYTGVNYTATVMVGTQKYDQKNQAYAPHGSVDSATARKHPGDIIQITGVITRANDTINYTIGCIVA